MPAWWLIWWLGLADLGVVGLGLRFVPLGFQFCRLGFLGFAAWVSVHGVVVVDGLGMGLGSPRGGWVFWVLPLGFQCTAW